jgi:hypothetical protein
MKDQLQQIFEQIAQVRQEMYEMRQSFQKNYENELLKSSKQKTITKAIGKLGEDKVSEIRGKYQEELDQATKDLKQKLEKLEQSFEALSQEYQFPNDNGGNWTVYKTSYLYTYSTQGLGADSYARNALSTSVAHCTALGLENKVSYDQEVRAYRLWIKGDEVDVAIAKNKPGLSLVETVRVLWKSGVNPRVIFPFLPWGFEEKHGISYT